jgi:hypothetical protein
MIPGEEKAWECLAGLDPSGTCSRTLAVFDGEAGRYTLKSFCTDIHISPSERKMSSTPEGDIILKRYGYFSVLSTLWYLTGAKEIPLSGELVSPTNLKGGQLFFRGTHVLPLDKLAEKYGKDAEGFLSRGKGLCGEKLGYGDASIRLFPFPRVPVVIILWKEDDEFPARADLLFDTTCMYHLPLDIVWSTAMMSVLIML